jgi:hypothetical protein
MADVVFSFLGNRWGQMVLVAVAAYFYGFWSVPRVDVQALVQTVETSRDNHWKAVLAEKERENETRVAAAVAAAEAEPPVSADRAERLRQCAASPSCRDRNRQ